MRRRALSLALWAVVFGAPVGAALFKVWVYQDAVQLGYRLSEREDERQRLRNDLRELEVELWAERSPAHLVELAKTLGLEPPAPAQQLAGEPRRARVVPPPARTPVREPQSGGGHGRP